MYRKVVPSVIVLTLYCEIHYVKLLLGFSDVGDDTSLILDN